jgi:carbon-monoxide dehydrogenase medium subunit
MYEFTYHRPATVAAAAKFMAEEPEAKIIAGGYTLIPVLKQRLARPACLVDISRIPGLAGIATCDGELLIGAMTRHAAIAASPIVTDFCPALAYLAGLIGDPAVRNAGTIGGSLANNDPTADYAAACLALDATIETNRRALRADDFFQGLF